MYLFESWAYSYFNIVITENGPTRAVGHWEYIQYKLHGLRGRIVDHYALAGKVHFLKILTVSVILTFARMTSKTLSLSCGPGNPVI